MNNTIGVRESCAGDRVLVRVMLSVSDQLEGEAKKKKKKKNGQSYPLAPEEVQKLRDRGDARRPRDRRLRALLNGKKIRKRKRGLRNGAKAGRLNVLHHKTTLETEKGLLLKGYHFDFDWVELQ